MGSYLEISGLIWTKFCVGLSTVVVGLYNIILSNFPIANTYYIKGCYMTRNSQILMDEPPLENYQFEKGDNETRILFPNWLKPHTFF